MIRPDEERPFQVRTPDPGETTIPSCESWQAQPAPEMELSLEDLEAAYLRALETTEQAEAALPSEVVVPVESDAENPTAATEHARSLDSSAREQTETTRSGDMGHHSDGAPPTLTSVLEALLFVGGTSLTTRKLSELMHLREADSVEPLIEQLNARYRQENRPYLVGFHQGGYRLELRPEYEPIRCKVYGMAPREVRLSQEALEALALVAYRQPISEDALRQTGRKNMAGLIRQLLRRELVRLERDEENPRQVTYSTTTRFLQLFGLGSLNELPHPEDIAFK